jgi:hypothetical protein
MPDKFKDDFPSPDHQLAEINELTQPDMLPLIPADQDLHRASEMNIKGITKNLFGFHIDNGWLPGLLHFPEYPLDSAIYEFLGPSPKCFS